MTLAELLNPVGRNIPRQDVTELVKWAIYQESQSRQMESENVRFGTPSTLEEANSRIAKLLVEKSEMELGHQNHIEDLVQTHEREMDKLRNEAEEAGIYL
jgi:hypothetical protein